MTHLLFSLLVLCVCVWVRVRHSLKSPFSICFIVFELSEKPVRQRQSNGEERLAVNCESCRSHFGEINGGNRFPVERSAAKKCALAPGEDKSVCHTRCVASTPIPPKWHRICFVKIKLEIVCYRSARRHMFDSIRSRENETEFAYTTVGRSVVGLILHVFAKIWIHSCPLVHILSHGKALDAGFFVVKVPDYTQYDLYQDYFVRNDDFNSFFPEIGFEFNEKKTERIWVECNHKLNATSSSI